MRVKKFSSRTVADALADVRRAFGDDAVILSTRRVGATGGFEVVAGREESEPPGPRSRISVVSADPAQPGLGRRRQSEETTGAYPAAGPTPSMPIVFEPPAVSASDAVAGARDAGIAGADERTDRAALLAELRDLRGRLETMTDLLLSGTPDDLSDDGRAMHLRLTESGLDPRMATAVVRRAEKLDAALEDGVREAISGGVRIGGALERGVGQQVVAFVGPTGVGKTTTCAKLAARLALWEGRSVALISADSFRVGASHQLGFYADILEVPFHVAYDRQSLATAIKASGGAEVILLDTTGRGAADPDGTDEIATTLGADPRTQSWLVLSATAGAADNLMALRTFGRLRPAGLVVTKLDETTAPGAVATLAIRSTLPIRYFSDGQTVPDDLFPAERATVPSLVLTGKGR